MKKFIRYFWLLSLRKFRREKRYYALRVMMWKTDILHDKQQLGMYFRSRTRIIDLKFNPPIKDSDPRLDLDIEALFTMSKKERFRYEGWISKMRNDLHRKEDEQYFSPAFQNQLKLIKSLQ